MAEQDPSSNQSPDPASDGSPLGGATPSAPSPSPADAIAEAALKAAQDAVSSLQGAVDGVAPIAGAQLGSGVAFGDDAEAVEAPAVQQFPLPSFTGAPGPALPKGIDLLSDVNLHVKIELGRTRMLIEDVLKLGEGAVVELDKLAGDPVDVFVNDRHIAKGEVLVLNDNFCVRINEIVKGGSEADGAVKAS